MLDGEELEVLGLRYGTDKTFLGNGYLRNYARIFSDFRNRTFTLLEIGVLDGGSVRTWRDYFERARIVGLDIDPNCKSHEDDRITIEIGSQADIPFLETIGGRYRPSIIIDDGSHISDHQIVSLETLFPFLEPGGIYVVEDVFFQTNPVTEAQFRGTAPIALIDYLLEFARNRSGWGRTHFTEDPKRGYVFAWADSLEFVDGAVAIRKRKDTRIDDEMLALAESTIAASKRPFWKFLYDFAMKPHVRRFDFARRASKAAFELDGNEDAYRARTNALKAADP